MPRIPGPPGQAPLRQIGFPENAGAAAREVAKGLGEIGNELIELRERQIHDRRLNDISNGEVELQRLVNEADLAIQERGTAPLFDEDGKRVEFNIDLEMDKILDGLRGDFEDYVGKIDDPAVQDRLRREADKKLLDAEFNLGTHAAKIRADREIAALPAKERVYFDEYHNAQTDEGRERARTNIHVMYRMARWLTAQQQEDAIAGAEKRLDAESAARDVENMPEVLAGLSDAQLAKRYPSFDLTERRSVASGARAKVGAVSISDIEIGIGRSTSQHELGILERRTESLLESNLITPAKRAQVIKAIDARREAIKDDVNLMGIFEAGVDGIPLDPNDPDVKKAIDAGFRRELARAVTPEEARAVEANIIESTHIVPETTVSRLRAVGNSNNADAIAAEAQTWEDYKTAAPQIIMQVPERARIMYDNVAQDTRAGLTAAESVSRTRDVLKLDEATTSLRKKAYEAAQRDESDVAWLQERLGDFPGIFGGSAELDARHPIAGPFSANVERHFMLDPDIDAARRRAAEDLANVAGQSRVGARQSIMLFPPEKVYTQFGGDSDAINKQLVDDVLSLADTMPDVIRDELADIDFASRRRKKVADSVVIISDPQTRREYFEGRLAPGYQIHFIDPRDERQLIPFINPETGEPHRFYPRFEDTEEWAAHKENIERRKREDAENRELNAKRALDRDIEILLQDTSRRRHMGLPGKAF